VARPASCILAERTRCSWPRRPEMPGWIIGSTRWKSICFGQVPRKKPLRHGDCVDVSFVADPTSRCRRLRMALAR
jgi:hypothetical protein